MVVNETTCCARARNPSPRKRGSRVGQPAGPAPSDVPLRNTRIAFIGTGAMAEAMIGGLLADHLVEPSSVIVASHHRGARTAHLKARLGVAATWHRGSPRSTGSAVVALYGEASSASDGLQRAARRHSALGAGALDCGRRAHRVNRARPRPPRHRSIHAEYASAGRRRHDGLDRNLGRGPRPARAGGSDTPSAWA